MRKILFIAALAVVSLINQSCHDTYLKQIDDLKTRVAALDEACVQINSNIRAVNAMVMAIEANDMITGVSEVVSQGKVIGYTINFLKSESITIYDGISGSIPYLGTVRSGDKYYWTIQYGLNGEVDYLRDSDGNMVQAVATLPYLDIKNDKWRCTVDGGKTWTEIGQATGDNADAMISSVDNSNKDYVLFKMANGTTIKIPRYSVYQELSDAISTLNFNTIAQKILIDTELAKVVYISKVEPVIEGADTIGTHVELSNGQSFTIRDWKGTNVPVIRSQLDATDGNSYWVIQYGDEPYNWIINANGGRILVQSADTVIPSVGVAQVDGQFYWTVTYGADTTFVTKPDSTRIVASDQCFAADSCQVKWFKSIVDDDNYLTFTFIDGKVIRVPHQYTIEYQLDSVAVSGNELIVAAGDTVRLSYSAIGGTVSSVVTMTEGKIKATESLSGKYVDIITADNYGRGSVSLIFTFGELNSTNTKIKKFIIREEDE